MTTKHSLILLVLVLAALVGTYTPAFVEYTQCVLDDGDWLNDWLTHFPPPVRGLIKFYGKVLFTVKRLSEPAPGDNPWEDTWTWEPLVELLYWISARLENDVAYRAHNGRCVPPTHNVPNGAGRWWTCEG